jgi:hypothetical protein
MPSGTHSNLADFLGPPVHPSSQVAVHVAESDPYVIPVAHPVESWGFGAGHETASHVSEPVYFMLLPSAAHVNVATFVPPV